MPFEDQNYSLSMRFINLCSTLKEDVLNLGVKVTCVLDWWAVGPSQCWGSKSQMDFILSDVYKSVEGQRVRWISYNSQLRISQPVLLPEGHRQMNFSASLLLLRLWLLQVVPPAHLEWRIFNVGNLRIFTFTHPVVKGRECVRTQAYANTQLVNSPHW